MIADLTDSDRSAAIALCAAGLDLPEDAVEARHLVDRLFDPPADRRTVRLRASDGSGVAFGSISDREPGVGHVELVVVDPDRRLGGLGRALVTALEQRLGALGATEVRLAANPPCYAWPGIDVRYTAAVCMAGAMGYEQISTAWNMTADLTALGDGGADEERLTAAGIEVGPGDPSILDWIRRTWDDGWAWEVGQSLDRPETGCYVAWQTAQGRRPLGFAAYGANRPSWFGPMGTDPGAGRLGIGRVLLRRCLADQRAAGLSTAQIGWAGPIAFYSRAVGARLGRIFWAYSRKL